MEVTTENGSNPGEVALSRPIVPESSVSIYSGRIGRKLPDERGGTRPEPGRPGPARPAPARGRWRPGLRPARARGRAGGDRPGAAARRLPAHRPGLRRPRRDGDRAAAG